MLLLFGLAAILLLVLNISVSVRVLRNELTTPAQKAAHIGTVWLLPYVGGLVVLQLPYLRDLPYTPGQQPIGGDGGTEGAIDFGGFDGGDSGGDGDG